MFIAMIYQCKNPIQNSYSRESILGNLYLMIQWHSLVMIFMIQSLRGYRPKVQVPRYPTQLNMGNFNNHWKWFYKCKNPIQNSLKSIFGNLYLMIQLHSLVIFMIQRLKTQRSGSNTSLQLFGNIQWTFYMFIALQSILGNLFLMIQLHSLVMIFMIQSLRG